jgi:NADPH:quinone reductase-like Zn-dependent oxidoreductase
VATVDYRDPELAAHLRDLAPGGIDVHWETSGHHDFDVVAAAVAIGGRVLLTASAGPHREPPLPVPALYTRDVSLVGFVISRARASDLGDAAGLINGLLRAGRLSARIADVLPLSATGEAHRRMEAGEVDGRVLLDPARA